MLQFYKYLFSTLIVLMFSSALWAAGGVLSGAGTDASPYLIEDYEDLKVVGSTTAIISKVYKLANDIDASASKAEGGFSPIPTSTTYFKGKFLGDGHKITDLYVSTTARFVGLFGTLYGSTAKVQDLTLENCVISNTSTSAEYVGGIVGYARTGATLTNCHVIGDTVRSGGTAGWVGGICGNSNVATISDCSFDGYLEGANCVGGIVGYMKSTSPLENCSVSGEIINANDYTGGIVGFSEDKLLTISNCYNDGKINGVNYTGGILGYAENASIDSCYNQMQISSSGNLVGGIVGQIDAGELTYCSNIASITGNKIVGGIAGYLVSANALYLFNTGNIQTLDGFTGGIVGSASGGLVSICYNTGELVGDNHIGGIAGYISSNQQINNTYSSGIVKANITSGSFVGQTFYSGDILNSYAIGHIKVDSFPEKYIGGFVGFSYDSYYPNSYFNTQTTGYLNGVGVFDSSDSTLTSSDTTLTALNDLQMRDSNYIDFDYSAIWGIRNDSTYPALKALDNAPFAIIDTLYLSAKNYVNSFALSDLMENDFDYETIQDSLFMKVLELSTGVTDSVSTLSLPAEMKNGDSIFVEYRIGEERAVYPDSLWGNAVTSVLVMDNHTPILQTDRYITIEDSITTFVLDITDSDGDSIYCTVLDSLENGHVTLQHDTMVYYPDSGFFRLDSVNVIISDGFEQDTAWIKIFVYPLNGILVDAVGTEVEMNKMFDGNTSATVIDNGQLVGVLAEDSGKVNLVAVANYKSSSVGENKVIYVDYYLTGDSAYKYIAPESIEISSAKISMFITLSPLADVETEDEAISVYLPYTILTGDPIDYRIVFGDEAIVVGFSDISYTALSSYNANDSLEIQLPAGLSVGTYSASLQMRNEIDVPSMMYSFNIVTCIPSAWVKLYNGQVLYVENVDGFFVSYQWYKNGVLIEGATSQSYVDADGFSGTYVVKAVDADGNEYYSNSKYFSQEVDFSKNLAVYPNPVTNNQVATLTIVGYSDEELSEANVRIYDPRGVECYSAAGLSTINTLRFTEVGGIYVVRVTISGVEKIIKVIVD